jgi:hypothetical protein
MRLLQLKLDDVWIFAAVAFVALRVFLSPIPPHDFWWHMATGRVILETGSIPTVDSFSYTRNGEPFYNQSWLAQVLMYGLFRIGGIPLLIVVQAVMLAAAYGLLLHICLLRSNSLRLSAGFFMLLTLPASFDNWTIRPQTYAVPLFIIWLYMLQRWRLGRLGRLGWLWFPLLAVVWVNIHGSFVLGGALIGLVFVGEGLVRLISDRREELAWADRPVGSAEDVLERPERTQRPPLQHLFLAGALTGLAWLINPGGLQVITYVRNLLGNSAVTSLVTEWAPPTIRGINGTIFFLFVLAAIIILSYARNRPNPVDMLLFSAFLWLALGASRNVIWFIALATPFLVAQATTWRRAATQPEAFQGLPILNGALVTLIGLMLLVTLPWVKPLLALPPDVGNLLAPDTPVAAVDAMQNDPQRPERIFHAMSYGSYLIWAAPEQPVWADPRIELYPFEQWRDYQRLSAGRDVEQVLDTYNIDGLLLSHEQQADLIEYIRNLSDGWILRYEDEYSSYFVRTR